MKQDGDRVEIEKFCFSKSVQRRQLKFIDKDVINNAIDKGASVVLEGIDLLDAGVNEFVARVDNSLPCVLSNAEVFFSQQDNEAYDPHCDADDVLVVQLAGKKTWNLYAPQQRRYSGIENQSSEQLGPVTEEFTMRPGDAIYLRAGVPHRCITNAPFSLHMSFDLVDNSPRVMDITKAATNQYLYACELPYAPLSDVIERYAGILKSTEFQSALVEATEFKRAEVADFRKKLGRTSAVKSLNKFS